LATRNVSPVAGLPGAVGGKGFLRKRVKLAIARISLDGCVEPIGVKRLEPGSKTRQFVGR
jgi:hypothetical protein